MRIPYIRQTISKPQLKFIEGLLLDCGYAGNRIQRNYMLTRVAGRKIEFLGDLSFQEAGMVINELKEIKERKNNEHGRKMED